MTFINCTIFLSKYLPNHITSFYQSLPIYELSSFVFFLFPMIILIVLYIRMGLKLQETSQVQRNLPRASFQSNCSAGLIQGERRKSSFGSGSFSCHDIGTFNNTERHLSSSRAAVLRMLGKK